MVDTVQLARAEILIDRPFTHPEHAEPDLAVLHYMLDDLRTQFERIPASHTSEQSITFHFPGERGYQKRIILFHPARLWDERPLTVIGFFGQRTMPRNVELEQAIFDIGHDLIHDLHQQPGIISYSTTLLADAYNYANLVLLDSAECIEQWRQNKTHQRVNDLLSPYYYANVRIYNGRLTPGGLIHRPRIELVHVKYFDYQCPDPWRAIRMLHQPIAP